MNEFYSHEPNTYSYREVNNNIQHILSFVHVWKNYNQWCSYALDDM